MSPLSPTFHPLPQVPLLPIFWPQCPLPRTNARTSPHAYIDNILIKSEDVVYIQNRLNYFDGPARAWGLDMKMSKTEVHANGTAPQKTLVTPRGSEFLTYNKKKGALTRAINTWGYIFLNTTKPRARFTCPKWRSRCLLPDSLPCLLREVKRSA